MGLIRLIDNKGLETQEDRSSQEGGLITDRSCSATRNTDTNKLHTCALEDSSAKCPYGGIVDLYHAILPRLARVRVLSEKRKGALNARWREKISSQDGLLSNALDWWRCYFEYVGTSGFLMGKAPPSGGREKPFIADFEWLINKNNLVKVIEGKYHR